MSLLRKVSWKYLHSWYSPLNSISKSKLNQGGEKPLEGSVQISKERDSGVGSPKPVKKKKKSETATCSHC